MISKTQENRADKVKQMDEVNVRDSYIPKELRDTPKRADEKSHIFKEQNLIQAYSQTSKEGNSSISSQTRERRKLLGGHCECSEKQAFGFIIIELLKNNQILLNNNLHLTYNFKKI
ncbi:hypothetical protein PHAVU_002G312700 [Phaseolus vulgaris]|uniref:Uncharacterized protein n=1 Tax=Phaseolus vulgaris TaxID=3885 RepID=V7CTV6_PHAVU|nr:hypothetical protein PHAVU_002G312700g [Phaseolus vulgaris]ESW32326.1 hypothetical protein PHAVU_002G312700g [Phaseolus vulgaris]